VSYLAEIDDRGSWVRPELQEQHLEGA